MGGRADACVDQRPKADHLPEESQRCAPSFVRPARHVRSEPVDVMVALGRRSQLDLQTQSTNSCARASAASRIARLWVSGAARRRTGGALFALAALRSSGSLEAPGWIAVPAARDCMISTRPAAPGRGFVSNVPNASAQSILRNRLGLAAVRVRRAAHALARDDGADTARQEVHRVDRARSDPKHCTSSPPIAFVAAPNDETVCSTRTEQAQPLIARLALIA
jgi:hypothetical protein